MPRLQTHNVEFKEIRESIREFMSDSEMNPDFSDYDFEGSNLSTLINLLAYVAHYHVVYDNFVLNESNLHTARTRAGKVASAKSIGYTPRSRIAPTMIVDLTITDVDSSVNELTLTRGMEFRARGNTEEHIFVVPKDVSVARTSEGFVFNDLELRGGKLKAFKYQVGDEEQRYEIPSDRVDTSLLSVRIQDDPNISVTRRFQRGNFIDAGPNTEVYWLQEGINGRFEVEFGDGNIGKSLNNGNIVHLSYVVTDGPEMNGIRKVKPIFNIAGGYDYTISTKSAAFGGEYKESKQSIAFSAPKAFAAQNRAVTTDDYKHLLQQNIGNIRAIRVWGGEDNNPPQYGKVFFTMDLKDQVLTKGAQQNIIQTIINPKKLPAIIPEFVEPSYINFNITADLIYDATQTGKNRGVIVDKVEQTIKDFVDDQINSSESETRVFKSQAETDLQQLLPDDGTNARNGARPIKSANINFTLTKIENVPYERSHFFQMDFNNPLEPGSISTNQFTAIRHLMSNRVQMVDQNGELFLQNTSTGEISGDSIGTINYEKGTLSVNRLELSEYRGNFDRLYVTAKTKDPEDVRFSRNQFIRIGQYAGDSIANVPNPLNINLSVLR